MSRNNEALEALRQRVLTEHRRATNKVSRMKQAGAAISATELDPRRNINNVKRYTTRQLEAYSAELQQFNRRGGGQVPLRNENIPYGQWLKYKSAERRLNAAKSKFKAETDDLHVKFFNSSLSDLRAVESKEPGMGGSETDRLIKQRRRSRAITDRSALKKMVADMEKKSDDFVGNRSESARRSIQGMIDALSLVNPNVQKLKPELAKLTDMQLFALWSIPQFRDELKIKYELNEVAQGRSKRATQISDRDRKFSTEGSYSSAYDMVKEASTWQF